MDFHKNLITIVIKHTKWLFSKAVEDVSKSRSRFYQYKKKKKLNGTMYRTFQNARDTRGMLHRDENGVKRKHREGSV